MATVSGGFCGVAEGGAFRKRDNNDIIDPQLKKCGRLLQRLSQANDTDALSLWSAMRASQGRSLQETLLGRRVDIGEGLSTRRSLITLRVPAE